MYQNLSANHTGTMFDMCLKYSTCIYLQYVYSSASLFVSVMLLLQKGSMELTKRLDHITWKSEMMEKKMADMKSSTQMMNKAIASTQECIDDLK